jgi:ABC-type lipoprotein release transport system permease subunit
MRSLRIGLLLGWRQIQRANIWTTTLIIFVMAITFLNLIAVSGILVGLIVGSERAVQSKSIGDIVINERDGEGSILETQQFIRELSLTPEVAAFTVRYTATGLVEANYTTRRDLSAEADIVNGRLVGIDPLAEDNVTAISENVVEGDYLNPTEDGYILVGSRLLDRYTEGFPDVLDSLENVYPGDKVRITIGNATKEFTVKGILDLKVDDVAGKIFMPERELRRLSGNFDRNANEISMILRPNTDAEVVKENLLSVGLGDYGKIRTFNEALPKFLIDIKNTFNILGIFIGAIGIVVASITIFIIIFINAISRQRQIGILKGIGIEQGVIEIAYVLQAAFYAVAGAAIGTLVTYGFLVGYFDRNPIDFPFSDGILVAEPMSTFIRFAILFVITLIAGFLPAWIIVKKNTLNSILGRK